MKYPPEDDDIPTGCFVLGVIVILFIFFSPLLVDWISNHIEIKIHE